MWTQIFLKTEQNTCFMILIEMVLGSKAELHYRLLEAMALQESHLDFADKLNLSKIWKKIRMLHARSFTFQFENLPAVQSLQLQNTSSCFSFLSVRYLRLIHHLVVLVLHCDVSRGTSVHKQTVKAWEKSVQQSQHSGRHQHL